MYVFSQVICKKCFYYIFIGISLIQMKKKKLIYLFLAIFIITMFFIANQNTTRTIGINYEVSKYQIPVYLKILDFYDRHYTYKHFVKNLNKNTEDKNEIVINTSNWIYDNIKKIPKGVDVIDNHPLTIIERRLGADDQFSDLLSVLLVYSNIESFFISKFNENWHPITFFKIDDNWSIIDPYNGIFFTNNNKLFASIKDIKNNKWELLNLKFEKIDKLNFKDTFGNKFDDYDNIHKYYDNIIDYIPSEEDINNTHIFHRGGRSNTQNPLGRLRYEIYNIMKGITRN